MSKQILLALIFMLTSVLYAQSSIHGEVSSRDLLTHDVQKAEKFYTTLFGWKGLQKDNYIQLQKDDIPIANIVHIDSKKRAQWMPQFLHTDLKLAKTNILKNGGSILKEKTDEKEEYILVRDKQGALSILSNVNYKQDHTKLPSINEWLWDELWSHDITASEHFYIDLFNYETGTTQSGYIIFKNKQIWLSGLLNNPFKESQTQWISTIRVNDPKTISTQALALGGKVLVSVEENKGHRNAALLADPTGAVFIVEKYEEKGQ